MKLQESLLILISDFLFLRVTNQASTELGMLESWTRNVYSRTTILPHMRQELKRYLQYVLLSRKVPEVVVVWLQFCFCLRDYSHFDIVVRLDLD